MTYPVHRTDIDDMSCGDVTFAGALFSYHSSLLLFLSPSFLS